MLLARLGHIEVAALIEGQGIGINSPVRVALAVVLTAVLMVTFAAAQRDGAGRRVGRGDRGPRPDRERPHAVVARAGGVTSAARLIVPVPLLIVAPAATTRFVRAVTSICVLAVPPWMLPSVRLPRPSRYTLLG